MNDFERQLSRQPLRQPPAAWRAEILAACAPAWTWRDWLWPSPVAWGALAATWLIFLGLAAAESWGVPSARVATVSASNSPTAFPFRSQRECDALLASLR